MMSWINKDLADWLEMNALGLEEAGAERSRKLTQGILSKTVDADGNTIEPFFGTSDFGIKRPTS